MKKILIITMVIFVLLVAALTVFVLTFDANRYKGVLITKLEESIGRDIRIDNISLSLLRGLEIELKNLAIKDRDKTWDNLIQFQVRAKG